MQYEISYNTKNSIVKAIPFFLLFFYLYDVFLIESLLDANHRKTDRCLLSVFTASVQDHVCDDAYRYH